MEGAIFDGAVLESAYLTKARTSYGSLTILASEHLSILASVKLTTRPPDSDAHRPQLDRLTIVVLSARRPRRVVRGLGRAFLYLSIYLSSWKRAIALSSCARSGSRKG